MLGDRIRRLRKERRMSLEELAEYIGTTRQTVHRYETGAISNIPHEKVEAMASALGTTPSRLMGWEDDFSSFNTIKKTAAADFSAVAAARQCRFKTLGLAVKFLIMSDQKTLGQQFRTNRTIPDLRAADNRASKQQQILENFFQHKNSLLVYFFNAVWQ